MKFIKHLTKHSFLLIIPLLILIYFLYIDKPLYCGDPDYNYFLNGLNLNIFRLPVFSDHPGTPLIMIAAIGIRFIYWFSGQIEGIQTDFLTNPAFYETRLHLFLFSLVLLTTIISGYYIYKKTRNIPITLLLQSTPFIFHVSIGIIATRFIPDILLLLVILLMYPLLIDIVLKQLNNNNTVNYQKKIYLPILCGLGLAVKIIFFPFIILPMLINGLNYKKVFRFILITTISFIVFTLPIIKQYPYMFKWFYSLLSHSGIYGQGDAAFINSSVLLHNIKYILTNNQLISIFFIAISVLFFYFSFLIITKKNSFPSYLYKILSYIIISQVISIILTSKHFDGKDYYLITTYCLTSLALVVTGIIFVIQHKFNKTTTYILTFTFFAFVLFMNFNKYKEEINGWKMTKEECTQIYQFVLKHPKSKFVNLCSYSLNKEYALFFGDVYSKVHNDKLKQIYPNVLLLNEEGKFLFWGDELNSEPILKSDTIFVIDSKISDNLNKKLSEKGYKLKLILTNRTKAIYELQKNDSIIKEMVFYDAMIKLKMKSIKEDEKWLTLVKEKAIKNKIPLDSMIYLDAKWTVDNYNGSFYDALIKDKIQNIKQDDKWLNTIREKAIKNKISIDSMLYMDAKWMIDNYGQ